jgi:hypothetical protein
MLYADDQILLAGADDDELQVVARQLNVTANKYKMKISTTKTKPTGICGNKIPGVSIHMKYHIDIESFYRFRKFLFPPAPNNFTAVLRNAVHKFTLHCSVPLLIKTFCLDVSDNVYLITVRKVFQSHCLYNERRMVPFISAAEIICYVNHRRKFIMAGVAKEIWRRRQSYFLFKVIFRHFPR